MSVNRGKDFEKVIRNGFNAVPNTAVTRLHDQTNGYKGGANICDFIVYHFPHQYFIECKSIHSNTFPIRNVTDVQREGMLKMAKIQGVYAGVIVWFVTRDRTVFIPIQLIEAFKQLGFKSIRWDETYPSIVEIPGKKKKVYFDYDMSDLMIVVDSLQLQLM